MMSPQHEAERIAHPLEPVFDERSRVLVLGTMPSPKSREVGFYYGHPQNRFWRVMAALFEEPVARTNERRRDQMLRHHIALWDVAATCTITGASDASITDVTPNDLARIIDASPIEAVFCTGAKSAELYARHCQRKTGIAAVKLPSTSAANAAWSLQRLVESYRRILAHLHEFEPPALDVEDVVMTERRIAEAGTSLAELMDRAGIALAHRIHEEYPNARIAVLCGNGNNGGDGWVSARELLNAGHEVTLAFDKAPGELKAQPARDAAAAALLHLEAHGATLLARPTPELLEDALARADVIVDALLGTGFSGSFAKAPFDSWIASANARHAQGGITVAADCPSGLNAQTGNAGRHCIEANQTVTMIVPKTGFSNSDAQRFCGKVHVAPLAYIEPLL